MTRSSTDRKWYYVRGERRFGPIPYDELWALAARGQLRATDLVWTPGLAGWLPAGEIEGLVATPPASATSSAAAIDDEPPVAVQRPETPSSANMPRGSVPSVRTAAPGASTAPAPEIGPTNSGPAKSSPTASGPTEIPKTKPEGAGRRSNYLVRHWRGQLSLGVSYWVNGVLLSIVLGLGVFLSVLSAVFRLGTPLFIALFDDTLAPPGIDLQTGAIAGLLFIALLAAITLWQLVGIWRSASNNARKTGRWFWPRVAKVLVVLYLLGTTFQIGTTGSNLASVLGALEGPDFSHYVIERRGGSDLVLSGAINERSVGDVIGALDDPSITILRITSQGGLVDPAHRLGRYIRDNDVTVIAEGECVSACVMVLAASPAAAVSPGTTVMFQRVEPLAEFANPDLRQQRALSLREAVEVYREFGIAEWAIETAGRQQSWRPTLDQMIRMNLIDLIYDPASEDLVPAAGYCMDHPAQCGDPETPPAPTRSS